MAESTSAPMSATKLLWTVSIRLMMSIVVLGGLVFGPAGSLSYWNGWLFLAAVFIPMTAALIYLYRTNRSLLEKRLRLHEKQKEQKIYLKLSLVWFVISFLVPGLDYRFGWSDVPLWLIAASTVMMIVGYVLFIIVLAQNAFASRIIEIQENQRVIDTGLYSVVRHPMYMAAIIMYTATPLVLGSYFALIPTMLLPAILIYRIRNEEAVLRAGLDGYTAYTKRVKYRLIPFVY